MTINTTYEIICNLCGRKHRGESDKPPKFWMNMLIDNPHVDRDFTEKHICDCCALEIHDRHKKAMTK